MEYIIGIIDDDSSKITQLITCLRMGTKSEDKKICKVKYDDIKLKPIEIELVESKTKIIENIIMNKCDALIIDYKLSSQQPISYNGVELIKTINNRLAEFPMFILTSHEDDLFTKELFDAYLVFDFDRYISEPLERIELNTKLIEQVKKYRNSIDEAKNTLNLLLTKSGENVDIDDQILKLDSFIEKTICGETSLNDKMKKELSGSNLKELISKIDLLIKG